MGVVEIEQALVIAADTVYCSAIVRKPVDCSNDTGEKTAIVVRFFSTEGRKMLVQAQPLKLSILNERTWTLTATKRSTLVPLVAHISEGIRI